MKQTTVNLSIPAKNRLKDQLRKYEDVIDDRGSMAKFMERVSRLDLAELLPKNKWGDNETDNN